MGSFVKSFNLYTGITFSDQRNITCKMSIIGSVTYYVNAGNSNRITYFEYIFSDLVFKWLGFQIHITPYICFFVLVDIFWNDVV